MELSGQVALVTGGSRGIGKACALSLAEAGAAVALSYRDQSEAAAEVVCAIMARSEGRAFAMQADMADPIACRALVAATQERFGRLDILVNNAGHDLSRLLLDTTDADWTHMLAVHLGGMFACTRAALPAMIDRRYGRIITISSVWGICGAAGEVAYSAAKAGQNGFTRALALEVGALGITVNAVAPGAIDTDMNAPLTGSDLDDWLARTPVGRMGTPAEMAALVRYLAGPNAGFLTGQVISPNGGVLT